MLIECDKEGVRLDNEGHLALFASIATHGSIIMNLLFTPICWKCKRLMDEIGRCEICYIKKQIKVN